MNNTKTFQDFNLQKELLERLNYIQYKNPTPIQQQTIPVVMNGKDILASSSTGTGKTAAFLLPLLSKLIDEPQKNALILVPTRELGIQISNFAQKLIHHKLKVKIALLIGGQNMFKQISQLNVNPNLIIGTPGRVNDHIIRRTLKLTNTNFFVLDEADRMLDMGFSEQLEAITKLLPKPRQTLMFSATAPNDILAIANKYLNNPERISIGESQTPNVNIKQETKFVAKEKKFETLLDELDTRQGTIFVFVKTRLDTEYLAKKLRSKHKVDFIHGDLRQSRRDRVIRSFRQNKARILVCTDVAARGIDIPEIQHVINYDLPHCPEDYVHRIGRTGRAGASGNALCIVSPEDTSKWKAITYFIETGKRSPIKKSSSSGRRRKINSNGNSRQGFKNKMFAKSDFNKEKKFNNKQAKV